MSQYTSSLVTINRGSLGGTTFTATRTAPLVMRSRLRPTFPRSKYQSEVVTSLAASSGLWKGLSSSVRSAWQSYGSGLSKTKPTGTYYLTGREAMLGVTSFALVNYIRGIISTEPDGSAPVVSGWLNQVTLSTLPLVTAGTGFRIQMNNVGSIPMDVIYWLSYALPGSNATQRFKINQARWGKASFSGAGTVTVVFDDLTDGLAYWFGCRSLTQTNPFRMSQSQAIRSIAAPYL